MSRTTLTSEDGYGGLAGGRDLHPLGGNGGGRGDLHLPRLSSERDICLE